MFELRNFFLTALILFLSMGDVNAVPVTSVTIAGNLQDELGCPGDWQPECSATHITFDPSDDVWQETFSVLAGNWEYKAALNDSWDENYGAGAQADGANIPLSLSASTNVKFYYDDKTNWVTDNVNSRIVTVAGSFQDELGCTGDWQPDCLRSWLQDPDGDGLYLFSTNVIPVGTYEVKAAIDESWAENYGAGGAPDGPNIPFSISDPGTLVTFTFDSASDVLTINTDSPGPDTVTIAGSFQDELGCPGDWQPDCTATHLSFDSSDGVWQETFLISAGDWEYKAALNDSWGQNYGAGAQADGANIPLSLSELTGVKFYYDDETNWITDNVNSRIVTVAGSFQDELGCTGDWQPDCLRSWLQDPDGDGLYRFLTDLIPVGSYEAKAAVGESWAENYGAGGTPDGPNIPFSISDPGTLVTFAFDSETNVLTITTADQNVSVPNSLALLGFGLAGIGFARRRRLA